MKILENVPIDKQRPKTMPVSQETSAQPQGIRPQADGNKAATIPSADWDGLCSKSTQLTSTLETLTPHLT